MNERAPRSHDLKAPPPVRAQGARPAGRGRVAAFFDSDLLHSFLRSKLVVLAALLTVAMVCAAFLAPLIAPDGPYDLKSLSLLDANTPPAWEKGGDRSFPLGTDDQGRDILSTILYGTRSSMLIGICSVLLAVGIGLSLGLWAGYVGGPLDTVVQRLRR